MTAANAPAWIADALCAQTDPAVFFPDPGASARAAKAVCAACPVREACLAWAMASPVSLAGVWGGLTQWERRKLRNGRAA